MIGLKQLSVIAIVIALLGLAGQFGILTLAGPLGSGDIEVWGAKVGSIDDVRSTLTNGPYEKGSDLTFSYTMDWSVNCVSIYRAVVMTYSKPALQYSTTGSFSTSSPLEQSSPQSEVYLVQTGEGYKSSSNTFTHSISSSYTDVDLLYLNAYIHLKFELFDITVTPYRLMETSEFVAGIATGSITFASPDPTPTTGDLVVKTGTSSTTYISITGPNGYTQNSVPANTQKSFAGLEPGTYTITITRTGYETITTTANVLSGEITTTASPTWTLTPEDPEPIDPNPDDPVPIDPDDPDPIYDPDDPVIIDPDPVDFVESEYSWSETGIIVIAVGFIAGLLTFVFVPLPPNYKAFISALIVIAAIVAAHLMNTGAW